MTDPAPHRFGPFTLSLTGEGVCVTYRRRPLATIDPAQALAAARWVLKALGEK